jgi:hypothetical protein
LQCASTIHKDLENFVLAGVATDYFAINFVQVQQFADLISISCRQGDVYTLLPQFIDNRKKEGHVRRVIEIDPNLPRAPISMGRSRHLGDEEFRGFLVLGRGYIIAAIYVRTELVVDVHCTSHNPSCWRGRIQFRPKIIDPLKMQTVIAL